jgi:acyl-CoA thioester hydrolase
MNDTTFYHSTPIQIRFNDIDGLNHVNNSTIQEYFDLGRMHYMQDVLSDQIFKGDETLIVANINTDFLAPIYLKNRMVVETAITRLGNKSLNMVQQVINKETGDVKAICKSVMVAFNKITEDAIELKPEWREAISSHEKTNF